jgi:hypothetical protein
MPADPPVPETILVCECGVVAADYAGARCGRKRTTNIRKACPTQEVRIVAFEVVEPTPAAGREADR